jgi:hypothetical protein
MNKRFLPGSFISLLITGYISTPAVAISDLQGIQVVGAKSDDPAAFCADFNLTNREASRALKKAQEINKHDYLEHFDFLPCFVTGTGRLHHSPIRWEIRAGGNGTITTSDGTMIFLGCERCKASFGRAGAAPK